MARPNIVGWSRNCPKGHARDRVRRQRYTDVPSVAPGESRRRGGLARHPGAFSLVSLIRTLLGANPSGALRASKFVPDKLVFWASKRPTRRERPFRWERNGTNDVRPKGGVQDRTLSIGTAEGWPEGQTPGACLGAPEASGCPGKDTQDLWAQQEAQPHKEFAAKLARGARPAQK